MKEKGLADDTVRRRLRPRGVREQVALRGRAGDVLRYALYGFGFVHNLPTAGASFARCKRALRSWLRINPEYSRDPCPFVAMALIVEDLVKHGGPLGLKSARCVALMYDAYLRLGEAMALRMEDQGLRLPRAGRRAAARARVDGPLERSPQASKDRAVRLHHRHRGRGEQASGAGLRPGVDGGALQASRDEIPSLRGPHLHEVRGALQASGDKA